MRKPSSRLVVAATATLAISGFAAVPATAAGPRPAFQLPFWCGEVWQAATRENHHPVEKVDFVKVGGGTNDSPILASLKGRVVATGWDPDGAGFYATIDHGGGWTTQYFHMIRPAMVKEGATVITGQQLGNVGSTGDSSGPHLHYEQRRDNVIVRAYFDEVRTTVAPHLPQRITSKNCGAAKPPVVVADPAITAKIDAAPKRIVPGDRDGDGKADMALFRPGEGKWYIIPSGGGAEQVVSHGRDADQPVPGDYDRDGKTDLAVFRPAEGTWHILASSTGLTQMLPHGRPGDVPVPADYNGDGETDLAIFRPGESKWYIMPSGETRLQIHVHGQESDRFVPADYDGDGKADPAVFRPSEGTWYIVRSSGGTQQVNPYGFPTDRLVPGDYDGDRKTDLAIYRPGEGNWYVRLSADGTERITKYGFDTDIPTPADYDGDGKTDLAVFRPSEGKLYILPSNTGPEQIRSYTPGGGIPTPQPTTPQPVTDAGRPVSVPRY